MKICSFLVVRSVRLVDFGASFRVWMRHVKHPGPGEEKPTERRVRKLSGPSSSIGLVMEYNWRINGASLWEMERTGRTG